MTPPRVWSTRFIMDYGPGPFRYVVPGGMRAVVKHISAINTGAAASQVNGYTGGTNLWYASIPGHESAIYTGAMWVIYEGEDISMACAPGTMSLYAGGFLLEAA